MSTIVRHLKGENLGRFPAWMMRQAGRYLTEYRELRSKHSFWESAENPELAAEITLQPTRVLATDGSILFSDILTLPRGLGLPIEMEENKGPVLKKPLASVADFEVFLSFDPSKHTPYVPEALRLIRKELPKEKTLIGFAGAPWTVGCYLIDGAGGRGTRLFEKTQRWLWEDPESLKKCLHILTHATRHYLEAQVKAGAEMIQLFDTWSGFLPKAFFDRYYAPLLNEIFDAFKDIPTIYYTRGSYHLTRSLSQIHAQGLSVDSLLSLKEIEELTAGKFFLQGNLDPHVLLGTPAEVRKHTRLLVQEARKLSKPAILNLGHGILPGTPRENALAFLEEATTLWI